MTTQYAPSLFYPQPQKAAKTRVLILVLCINGSLGRNANGPGWIRTIEPFAYKANALTAELLAHIFHQLLKLLPLNALFFNE